MTLPIPTEAVESRNLMHYMRLKRLKFTHIKNETGRAYASGKLRNSRAFWGAVDGVSPGFPDFLVIVNNKLIAIEMKRQKGGTATPKQMTWLYSLESAGVPARVCRGADEAIAFIEEYL